LKVRTGLRFFSKLSAESGFTSTIACLVNEVLYSKKHFQYRLKGKSAKHPLWYRAGTSDLEVFTNVFCDKAYSYLERMQNVSFVIDCGANVGYFSALCLSMFPNCTVVALEPDKENFNILMRNLAPYGRRVNAIKAGVWSHRTTLTISEKPYRDGREWSKQVREGGPDEVCNVVGIDISTVMKEFAKNHISVLKMDIEGAETVVFSGNYEKWIQEVDVIMIELHDDSDFGRGSDAFFNAIKGKEFLVTHQGELTIARSLRYGSRAKAGE
jgi:FkbM family methyltransferase